MILKLLLQWLSGGWSTRWISSSTHGNITGVMYWIRETRLQESIWAQIRPCHQQRFNSDLPLGANVVFTPMLRSGGVITEPFSARGDDQCKKVECSLAVTVPLQGWKWQVCIRSSVTSPCTAPSLCL